MEIKRKQFQGVLNILNFNRHFYYFGIGALVVLIIFNYYTEWNSTFFYILIGGFIYGLVSPLLISAYVYDFSGYYNFQWLQDIDINPEKNLELANIHAGFDETSHILKKKFPNSYLNVFDFYNPIKHTEQAIIRARNKSEFYRNTKQISTDKIPLEDNSIDLLFLLSAAHEIRSQSEKIEFLSECKRICKPEGRIIIVEHLRDLPNFLAFTIGFTHFFSKKTWNKVISMSGLKKIEENKFTSFMSVFILKPNK